MNCASERFENTFFSNMTSSIRFEINNQHYFGLFFFFARELQTRFPWTSLIVVSDF